MKSGLIIRTDNASSILDALNKLSGTDVLVGIPADKAPREDGAPLNNAELGYLQSTGATIEIEGHTVTLPPRPFLDMGIEDSRPVTTEHLKAAAEFALEGKSDRANTELERAGMVASNAAKAVISAGDRLQQLSDATKERRREQGIPGDKPLYAHGYLLRSITYVVRSK